MDLGLRVISFCAGIGIAGIAVGTAHTFLIAQPTTTIAEEIFTTIVFVAIFAGFCILTSWVGFGLAQLLKRAPSQVYCGVLGAAFVVLVVIPIFAILDAGALHALGAFIFAGLAVVAAPIFAFLGSMFSRRV